MRQIFALVVLVFLSAFFSLAETALTTVSKGKIRHFLGQKLPGARALEALRSNPSRFLSVILVCNNVANIAASALATSMVIQIFENAGWGSIGLAVGIATGMTTFVILIFGEITPKTIAIRSADRLALVTAPIIELLAVVLHPLIQVLGFISSPLVRILGGRLPASGPFMTQEELKIMIALGEREGAIEESERRMLHRVFEFGDTAVREVMTPLPDVQALESSITLGRAIQLFAEGWHSRVPVYEENMDSIVGILYARDLLGFPKQRAIEPIRSFLRTALFVPEGKKLDELLHDMQTARTHLAIVVNEYGGTAGIVTLEDLIEEIVGEVYDEFEKVQKRIERVDDRTTLVDARMTVEEVNQALTLKLPTRDYDTLSGFVFGQIGKVPSVGDTVRYAETMFQVERVHRRRITRVRVTQIPLTPEESEVVGG